MLAWFSNAFPLYLAPMAGVTDPVFRMLCKEQGADVLVSEFVSAEGIFRRNARTLEYLRFSEAERPVGIQLFGAEPDHLGEAARRVCQDVAPDFIDLNFGCPVPKVTGRNGGSALLKDLPLLGRVACAVVQVLEPDGVPVTAKIRLGWSRETVNALQTARILEDAGVQALAVHGRTRDMGYSGEANWEAIDAVARAVRIPVVGNGDIRTPQDAVRRRTQTAVAGLMIGRGAMSAPWLFRQAKRAMEGESPLSRLQEPALAERWAFIRRHCVLAVEARGAERPAMHSMRARLMAYTHGLPVARRLRTEFTRLETLAGLDEIISRSLKDGEEKA